MKPPSKLQVVANPSKIYLGKDTTVQDMLDWINYFQAENYVLAMENSYLKHQMMKPPDNVVALPSAKPKRKRKPKAETTTNE